MKKNPELQRPLWALASAHSHAPFFSSPVPPFRHSCAPPPPSPNLQSDKPSQTPPWRARRPCPPPPRSRRLRPAPVTAPRRRRGAARSPSAPPALSPRRGSPWAPAAAPPSSSAPPPRRYVPVEGARLPAPRSPSRERAVLTGGDRCSSAGGRGAAGQGDRQVLLRRGGRRGARGPHRRRALRGGRPRDSGKLPRPLHWCVRCGPSSNQYWLRWV